MEGREGAGAEGAPSALRVRAPGRVNLIGEHTDYNDGFVLPLAIDRFCEVTATRRADRRLRVRSRELGEEVLRSLDDLRPERRWSDYPLGVAAMLGAAGVALPGADLTIASDVPPGGGLSSSAALEVAVAGALLGLAGVELEPIIVARLCQRAENEFVGARCGILDQLASLCSRADHALLLDCRSLEMRHVPLPPGIAVVVVDSGVRHSIAGGEYNERRRQCEEGVAILARARPSVRALRDLEPDQLGELRGLLPEVVARRCRHVVTENARVRAAVAALEAGRLAELGQLMSESHASLARDYEVSCAELDALVRIARDRPECLGSRMTGGGFGGCTVNLVRSDRVEAFGEAIRAGFQQEYGRTPGVRPCRAVDGAASASHEASSSKGSAGPRFPRPAGI